MGLKHRYLLTKCIRNRIRANGGIKMNKDDSIVMEVGGSISSTLLQMELYSFFKKDVPQYPYDAKHNPILVYMVCIDSKDMQRYNPIFFRSTKSY